jgi:hypothetical protein
VGRFVNGINGAFEGRVGAMVGTSRKGELDNNKKSTMAQDWLTLLPFIEKDVSPTVKRYLVTHLIYCTIVLQVLYRISVLIFS